MQSLPPLQIWLLGVTIALATASGWLLHRALGRYRLRARVRRATAGEARAVGLLESTGYRVYGEQVRGTYEFAVDGEPRTATVRADLLASRAGKRYVVEVKTGKVAKPTLAQTRRQLLEYRLAFGVQGVMLADMEAGRLYRVEFAFGRQLSRFWPAFAALVAGIAGGAALMRVLG